MMVTLSPDTSPYIEQMQIERLRQMPAWRKLALAGLRQRHPYETPAQRQRRLADLLLGSELAARVYGPVLEET